MKIDMGEVRRNQESLNASIKVLKSQLQSAQASLSKIVGSEGALDGSVKSSIDAKIQNHQLPLLVNYGHILDNMSKDYDVFVTTFQSEVGENDSNAILNTDYLSELGAIFSGISQALSYIQRDTSNIYSDLSDIISLKDPLTSEITTDLTEAKQILTETITKISAFNNLSTPGTFSVMMGQQNSELALLGSIQGPSYSSPTVLSTYKKTDFKTQVKKNEAENSVTYKIQLQNELAGSMAKSKYSGNISQEKFFDSMYKGTKDIVKWIANSNIIDNAGTALDIVGTGTMFVNSVGVKVGPKNGFVMGNASNMQNFSNASQKLSQISRFAKPIMVAGFAIGMADDILNNNKSVGQAFTHNATSISVSYLAGAGATAGVSYLAATAGVGFLASNPVGWGLAAALAGGYVASKTFDAAYKNNFLGIRDGLDSLGSALDSAVTNIGNFITNEVLNPKIPLF